MHRYRTHTCGELRRATSARPSAVRLVPPHPRPWRTAVHRPARPLRPHAVVADPDSPGLQGRRELRAEWVVRIDGGSRRARAGPTIPTCPPARSKSASSEIEVSGPAGELPMPVFGEQDYPEEIRLKYRFLDLRREQLHQNIMKRGAIMIRSAGA